MMELTMTTKRGNPASALSLKEAFMVVSFSTLAGGVFIEVFADGLPEGYSGRERCFRFNADGSCEYALHRDLVENGARARWFGHIYRKENFVFC